MEQGESSGGVQESSQVRVQEEAAAPAAGAPSGQATPMSRQRIALIVAAAAGMLGTFLPWINIPIRGAVNGTEGDGWITLGIFSFALLIAVTGEAEGLLGRSGLVLMGTIAAAVGVHDAAGVYERKAEIADGGAFARALADSVSVGGDRKSVV
jgi:hypothetical protein